MPQITLFWSWPKRNVADEARHNESRRRSYPSTPPDMITPIVSSLPKTGWSNRVNDIEGQISFECVECQP